MSVTFVWIAFTALGAACGGAGRIRAFDPLVGWAWLGVAFTTAGVLFSIPFSLMSVVAGVLASGEGVWVWRRDGGIVCARYRPRRAVDSLFLCEGVADQVYCVSLSCQGNGWDCGLINLVCLEAI